LNADPAGGSSFEPIFREPGLDELHILIETSTLTNP
jgi:hypothetical protein